MTKDEIEYMWKVARNDPHHDFNWFDPVVVKFAKLVAEHERELVANWLMRKGFATGHGDNIVDMLDELEWQIAEREREACAKIADELQLDYAHDVAMEIRARGQA